MIKANSNSELDLIFVHLPKTAGTSISTVLGSHFGESLYLDYADRPLDPTSPMNLDPEGFKSKVNAELEGLLLGIRAVTGHFWLPKYDAVRGPRAVVLRDPVQRTISHYFHWMNPSRINHSNSLQRYCVENQLSILEFARLPGIRWFYTKVFFRDVEMKHFDTILSYDEVTNDWPGAIAKLGINAPKTEVNVTSSFNPDYAAQKDAICTKTNLHMLEDILADDLAFYEKNLR